MAVPSATKPQAALERCVCFPVPMHFFPLEKEKNFIQLKGLGLKLHRGFWFTLDGQFCFNVGMSYDSLIQRASSLNSFQMGKIDPEKSSNFHKNTQEIGATSVLIQCRLCNVLCLVAQSCPTLLFHGLQPARLLCPWGFSRQVIMEWVAIPSSRGSSQLRDRTQVSSNAGKFFII